MAIGYWMSLSPSKLQQDVGVWLESLFTHIGPCFPWAGQGLGGQRDGEPYGWGHLDNGDRSIQTPRHGCCCSAWADTLSILVCNHSSFHLWLHVDNVLSSWHLTDLVWGILLSLWNLRVWIGSFGVWGCLTVHWNWAQHGLLDWPGRGRRSEQRGW